MHDAVAAAPHRRDRQRDVDPAARGVVCAIPTCRRDFGAVGSLPLDPPIINLKLRKGDIALSFFSAVTFLGRTRDITLDNLKIECFFPADAATDAFARRLAAMPDTIAV